MTKRPKRSKLFKQFPHKETRNGLAKCLILVRHAESEGNVLTVDQRTEFTTPTHAYGLTARGRRQAEITGQFLKDHYPEFGVRYVSYYKRSRETMEIMCPGKKVYEDPRLAEAQRGIFHTMSRESLKKRFPEELERKEREGLYHYRPFGGENWPDVELRIHSFLDTLARDYGGERVLMVVHGHWLLLFQQLIHHFPIEETVKRYKAGVFENASVTRYCGRSVNGKSRLVLKEENVVPWHGLI